MNKEVISIIERVLEKEFYLRKNADKSYYEAEIYVDYNDQLQDTTIRKILDSEDPRQAFYDSFEDNFIDCEGQMMYDYLCKITDNLDELEIEYDEDEIREYLYENVCISIPYDHFLNQKVCANLILDTGDGNEDFTLNSDYNYGCARNEEFQFQDESSILWLANQQEYSKEQLENALNNEEYLGSNFLKSVCQEIIDTTSSMNALTFFIDTTFGDLLTYSENKTGVVVSKDTNCGLVDYWMGAGGTLDIQLEKDVIIPAEYIDSFTVDGNRGSYSADNIYGLSSSHWNGTIRNI